jgi:hypothetical protein
MICSISGLVLGVGRLDLPLFGIGSFVGGRRRLLVGMMIDGHDMTGRWADLGVRLVPVL